VYDPISYYNYWIVVYVWWWVYWRIIFLSKYLYVKWL